MVSSSTDNPLSFINSRKESGSCWMLCCLTEQYLNIYLMLNRTISAFIELPF